MKLVYWYAGTYGVSVVAIVKAVDKAARAAKEIDFIGRGA